MADEDNLRVLSVLVFMFCKIKKKITFMVDNITNHDEKTTNQTNLKLQNTEITQTETMKI